MNVVQKLREWIGLTMPERDQYGFTPAVLENPKAIEEYFCIPFSQLPCSEDGVQRSWRTLMKLPGWQDIEFTPSQLEMIRGMTERFSKYYNYILDKRSVCYLCLVAGDNYAVCVMYLTYVQYYCKKHSFVQCTFTTLIEQIFPNGFPDEDQLKKLWYSQKVRVRQGSHNLLDYLKPMTSILF